MKAIFTKKNIVYLIVIFCSLIILYFSFLEIKTEIYRYEGYVNNINNSIVKSNKIEQRLAKDSIIVKSGYELYSRCNDGSEIVLFIPPGLCYECYIDIFVSFLNEKNMAHKIVAFSFKNAQNAHNNIQFILKEYGVSDVVIFELLNNSLKDIRVPFVGKLINNSVVNVTILNAHTLNSPFLYSN